MRIACLVLIALVAGAADGAPDRPGLCVLLGGGGERAAALARDVRNLVHVLAADDAARDRARAAIAAAGLYGRASAETWPRSLRLPHADGIADLVEASADWPRAECERILAPDGLLVLDGAAWRKPRPAGIDAWTHVAGDAGATRRSADQLVGVPAAFQWIAGPEYEAKPKIAVDDLVVCIEPDERAAQPLVWARNAYNGLLRWSRPLAFAGAPRGLGWGWGENVERRFAACLAARPGLIVAATTPHAIGLATGDGREVAGYRSPSPPQRVLVAGDTVVVACADGVHGFAPAGGEPRWSLAGAPAEVVASDGVVAVLDAAADPWALVGVGAADGRQRWRVDGGAWWPKGLQVGAKGASAPLRLLAARDGRAILWVAAPVGGRLINSGHAEGDRLIAIDLARGTLAWSWRPADDGMLALGYANHVMAAPDAVWTIALVKPEGERGGGAATQALVELDPATGARRRLVRRQILNAMCQPGYLTGRFLCPRDNSIALADLALAGNNKLSSRAGCGTTNVPAYGLTFTGAHHCSCGGGAANIPTVCVKAQIDRARAGDAGLVDEGEVVTERGPAAGDPLPVAAGEVGWPTWLGDARRANAAAAGPAPATLALRWRADLPRQGGSAWRDDAGGGDRVGAPVAAEGLALVCDADAHTLHAVDAAGGHERWRFVAGGVLPAPPTLARGRVLLGCGDGWLYCLRASDGVLAWRTRLARGDRRIVMRGQLQSAWPVGAPLVVGDRAIAAAGWYRIGLHKVFRYGLDLATGAVAWQDDGGRRNDLLALDGAGLVDGLQPADGAAPPKSARRGRELPQGGEPASIARRNPDQRTKGHLTRIWAHGAARSVVLEQRGPDDGDRLGSYSPQALQAPGARPDPTLTAPAGERWQTLLIAGDLAWIAGIRGEAGFLRAVDPATLETRGELPLPGAPSFQGLACADGSLYCALREGALLRFGP